MSRRPSLLGLAVAGAALLSGPALASTNFPTIIRTESGASRVPSCTLCHATEAGGMGTANKPFVATLYTVGFQGAQGTTALRQAVQALRSGTQDTDKDGTRDFDELAASRDPNRAGVAGSANDCWSGTLQADNTCKTASSSSDGGTVIDPIDPVDDIGDPRYGCSAAAGAGGGLAAALLLALAGLGRRRRS